MKHSQWTIALAVLLCAVSLLSGTLLVLHADHVCCESACTVCPILARCMEIFLGVLAVFAAGSFLGDVGIGCCYGPPESRFVPEWTLVQRKVKLLN